MVSLAIAVVDKTRIKYASFKATYHVQGNKSPELISARFS